MRISKRNAEKIKITADDIRCFLVVEDCVWCGLRNGTIQILDRQTGKVIKRGEGKVGSINALVQAGDTVWSGDSEGSIAIWKSHNGELMKKLKGHTHGVTCLTSHSSTVWSASSDFSIKVWNSLTLKNTGILKGHRNHVKCMLWVNNALWSGSDDSNILVWSSTGEKRKLEGHKAAVLTMIQVDNCVWSASADKTILVWDTNNFQLVKELRGHTNWVSFLFPMGDSEVWSGSIDKRIVSWDKKEMIRKNEFLVDDGISYLLKADDTHVWAYSQTKKTLTIYPAAENSGEEFSENPPDRNLQSPDAFSENFLAENNLGENVSEGSEGRPSSSGSNRPTSAAKRLSQGPISSRNTLRANATNLAKIPKPNLANRNSTNSPNSKLEKSAEKRKQVLEQLDALKKTVAAEKKIMAAVSPRTPAGRALKTTPSGPLSSRARVPPALPSPRPKSLTLPDHNRMQLQHQVEELKDRLQIAISEKAIVDQEVQDLMDLIRSTPDLRPEIEKRDSILSKERADWAQERARYEGEAKAMKIALEEEESERVTRVRELAATRHEWEAQAKRLQSNSMTLKKQLEEKTKMMEEEERKLKGVERILLSVETKLNTKTKECVSAEERAKSSEGRWKMKKASYERKIKDAEDDLRSESSMRDKYQSKCSELETQTAELSLDVTKLTRKLQKTKKKLLSAEETLQAKEREMEAEQDRTLKQTQSLMDTVTETKLGVAAWLESSKNELEMANYSLSEKSDILEKEKRNLEKYVADMQKHWETTEAQVQFTKSELRKLSEENTKLNEELVKVRGRLVQESERYTSRSPNSARTPLSRASSRGPNSARSVLTPSPSFSSPSPSPSLKHRNIPLSSGSPVKKRRGKEKEEESEEESDDDEEDEEKKSMFFFENYHKINEEYENLKKKMEVELRIKQEMREQLSDYEKKIKETETQRSEALKASVARANQFDTDIKALMEQLEQREDKIEKLEKQKDELILQHIKSTPPITPRSVSSVSSVASIASRNSALKKSSSSLHREDEDVESDDLMGDFSDDEDDAYVEEEEEEELQTEEKREREERRDRGHEEEGGESEGDLMDQLTMLRATLMNLSGHVISELEENAQDRLQHFNSMKSISDDKQSLAKEKLALDWKMLFLKRRLHQQELDNEKTKDIDMAKAKMWDKIQKEKDDEVAVLEDKMRGERRGWLEEEEKARRKISGLEVDLEESKKENKKLKEQLERLLLRRTEPPHDTSSNGLVRSSSAKEVEKQSPEVEVRQRSHSILNL